MRTFVFELAQSSMSAGIEFVPRTARAIIAQPGKGPVAACRANSGKAEVAANLKPTEHATKGHTGQYAGGRSSEASC